MRSPHCAEELEGSGKDQVGDIERRREGTVAVAGGDVNAGTTGGLGKPSDPQVAGTGEVAKGNGGAGGGKGGRGGEVAAAVIQQDTGS